MKKSKHFLAVLFASLFAFCSCSSDKINTYLNSSLDDSQWSDPSLSSMVRQDFYLNDVHYVMNAEIEVYFDESFNLIGYFVNACDVEYWKSYDNNPLLLYAIEEHNSLINNTSDESLKNRFELYSINISDAIGLKNGSIMGVYEIVD